MNDSTYDKPSEQDKAFALAAIELARIASNAIDEMESYIENIENTELREKTAAEVENLFS